MGLADAFAEATFNNAPAGKVCGVQRAMEQLSDEDAEFLFHLITWSDDYPGHAAMAEWLAAQGLSLTRKVLGYHRLHQCGCSQRMPERYES